MVAAAAVVECFCFTQRRKIKLKKAFAVKKCFEVWKTFSRVAVEMKNDLATTTNKTYLKHQNIAFTLNLICKIGLQPLPTYLINYEIVEGLK